jgi:hypothetical protein
VYHLNLRVQPPEFDPGVVRGKAPCDIRSSAVTRCFPRRDFSPHCPNVANAPIQALTRENAQLNLGHVQPAGTLWGAMEFKAVSETQGLIRWKSLV